MSIQTTSIRMILLIASSYKRLLCFILKVLQPRILTNHGSAMDCDPIQDHLRGIFAIGSIIRQCIVLCAVHLDLNNIDKIHSAVQWIVILYRIV